MEGAEMVTAFLRAVVGMLAMNVKGSRTGRGH